MVGGPVDQPPDDRGSGGPGPRSVIISLAVAGVLGLGLVAAFAYTDVVGVFVEDDRGALVAEDGRVGLVGEGRYRDPNGNTCALENAHFGDLWLRSGLDADEWWCPASVPAGSTLAPPPPPPPPPHQLTFALVLTPQGAEPLTMGAVKMTQVAPRTVEVRVAMRDRLLLDSNPRLEIFLRGCDWLGLNERRYWGPVLNHVGRLTGRVTTLRMRGVTLTHINKRGGAIAYVDDSGLPTMRCADI